MANKRIYELTEDTTPASGDYIATDKSGEGAASKVNLNKLLLASGAVAGSASQAQDFAATGIKADVIAESTAAAGVTVDGVLLKDTAITLAEMGSAPATPASGKWTIYTKSDGVYVVDDAGAEVGPFGAGGGGGAPTDATYITQTANGSLSNEQSLSGLATGIVKVTNGTGVLSTATAGTDYAAASHSHAAGDVTSGTLAHERGGLEADVSAYSGLVAIASGTTAEVNSKAELEAQLADVSDLALANGDTYSGVHDFGGATSLEVPNAGGGTTIDANGEVTVDTTANTLKYFSGSARTVVETSLAQTLSGKTHTDPALTGQALSDAATTTMDCSSGYVATWTIAGNRTFALSNAPTYGSLAVAITQDGTGNRVVTWPGGWYWAGGTEGVLSTGAADIDLLHLTIINSVVYASLTKDYLT